MRKLIVLLVLSCFSYSLTAHADYANYDEARTAARQNVGAKNYAAARKDLAAAVPLAKTPAEKSVALALIGETYKLEGNQPQARLAWSKVLAMPDAPPSDRMVTQLSIGESYLDDSKPLEARAEFRKVIASKEFDLQPHVKAILGFFMGTTYLKEKNYAQARKEWDKVLASEPTAPFVAVILQNTRLVYGDSYLEEANYAQARTEYSKVLAAYPTLTTEDQQQLRAWNQYAQLNLGRSYLLEKNYLKAKAEYQKLFQMEPLVPDCKAEAEKQLKIIAEQEAGTVK